MEEALKEAWATIPVSFFEEFVGTNVPAFITCNAAAHLHQFLPN